MAYVVRCYAVFCCLDQHAPPSVMYMPDAMPLPFLAHRDTLDILGARLYGESRALLAHPALVL